MSVAVVVGAVALTGWFLTLLFALALARTAKQSDRAGSRLVLGPRPVRPAPQPYAR